jgi:hypothetical protein
MYMNQSIRIGIIIAVVVGIMFLAGAIQRALGASPMSQVELEAYITAHNITLSLPPSLMSISELEEIVQSDMKVCNEILMPILGHC